MFGSSSKSSSASASGAAYSGVGSFAPVNKISFAKPIVDITNPLEVAALGGLGLLAWWAWRKFK